MGNMGNMGNMMGNLGGMGDMGGMGGMMGMMGGIGDMLGQIMTLVDDWTSKSVPEMLFRQMLKSPCFITQTLANASCSAKGSPEACQTMTDTSAQLCQMADYVDMFGGGKSNKNREKLEKGTVLIDNFIKKLKLLRKSVDCINQKSPEYNGKSLPTRQIINTVGGRGSKHTLKYEEYKNPNYMFRLADLQKLRDFLNGFDFKDIPKHIENYMKNLQNFLNFSINNNNNNQ